jgi:RNA polymerase sigma-70 factor (ECF subfamily)
VGVSDVVQDTLVEALAGLSEFKGKDDDSLRRWLEQILLHNIVDETDRYWKSQKRDVQLEARSTAADTVRDCVGLPIKSWPTPSQDLIRREELESVERHLRSLRPADVRIIEFRSFDRLRFSEIGRRMGLSTDAARKKWKRAVSRLAARLSKGHSGGPGA